jgi:hypothetical protein
MIADKQLYLKHTYTQNIYLYMYNPLLIHLQKYYQKTMFTNQKNYLFILSTNHNIIK